jgi:hypothetical protein
MSKESLQLSSVQYNQNLQILYETSFVYCWKL